MLDIVPICNLVQHQEKLMMEPRKNGKNSNFGPNLGPSKFFSRALLPLVVRKCSTLSSYAPYRKTKEAILKK